MSGTTNGLQFNNCRISSGGIISYQQSSTSSTTMSGDEIQFNNCLMISGGVVAFKVYASVLHVNGGLVSKTARDGALVEVNSTYYSSFVTFHNLQFKSAAYSWTSILYNDVSTYYHVALNDCWVVGNQLANIANADAPTYEPLVSVRNMQISSSGGTGKKFQDRVINWAYNSTGGNLTVGQGVIFTAGDSDKPIKIATTTTANSPFFAGIVPRQIANGTYGPIITKGYVYRANVNGVTDITYGDLLSTFTVAGILAKPAAGSYCALSCGAYTTDNSSGIIPVYLFDGTRS